MTQAKQPVLYLQGNLGCLPGTNICVSTIGILNTSESFQSDQSENFSKVVEIVKTRSRSEQHALVSVIIDDEDFVPISFLEAGIKQSSSVCRIARYFSYSNFLDFVKSLEVSIEQLGSVPHNFDSVDKVIEIFSVPQQIANEVFSEPVRQQIQAGDKTPLKALQDITETQLAKILPIPIGTGFLVGGSHLLTNHHVIPDAETADQCVAQFSFAENLQGESRKSIDYEFDSTLFVSNPGLDYTLVQLKSGMFTRQAGFEFGWIRLVENDESIAPGLVRVEFEGSREQVLSTIELGKAAINALKSRGYTINAEESLIIWHPDANSSEFEIYEQEEIKELGRLMGEDAFNEPGKRVSANRAFKRERGDSVIVVQHPKGRQKQIVLNNNEVITNGLYKDFLRYKADADYGSSGSPAFNTRWELVALHHAAVPKKPEDFTKQSSVSDRTPIECHQGVRTCRIVEDLKRRSTDNFKLQSFVEDFVITVEQLNYPPLPAGLKFSGVNDYVSTDGKTAFASCAANFQESSDPRLTEVGVGTIKLWNSIGVELRTLIHPGVNKIEFSSDGKQLVSADSSLINPQLKLWNVNTGELIATFVSPDDSDQRQLERVHSSYGKAPNPEAFVTSETDVFDFSSILGSFDSLSLCPPNYEILATASSLFDKIILWDTKSERPLNVLDGDLLKSYPKLEDLQGSLARFSPLGDVLAASSKTVVQLWKVDGWELLKTIETTEVSKICFNADGKVIAIANSSLQFVAVEDGSMSELIKADVEEMEFRTVNGTEVLMSRCSDGFVRSWNLDGTLQQEVEIDPTVRGQSIQSTSFSPDGRVLLIFGLRNDISLYSLETRVILKRINHLNMHRQPANFPSAEVKFSPNAPVLDWVDADLANYTQAITVEAWVNPDLNGGGTISDIALHPSQGQPVTFPLGITSHGGLACLMLQGSGVGILDFGKFNHVAVVIELEAGSLKASTYINEQLSSTSSSSSQTALPIFPRLQLIGAFLEQDANSTSNLLDYFKGTISEVRLWNTARSLEQIKACMFKRLDSAEEGLVEYWKFEGFEHEENSNLVSKKGTFGISHGAKQLNASQLHGFSLLCGLKFSEDYRLANNAFMSSDLNADLKTAITVEAWAKHQFGNSLIVSQGSQDEQGNFLKQGYSIGWHNGKIRVVIQDGSSQESLVIETRENAFRDQTWHHVAFTWAYGQPNLTQGGEVSIYIDGRLQDSVVIEGRSETIVAGGKSQTFGVFAGSLESVTDPLQIGIKAVSREYRSVAIADVRLWNVCRPQDQIKANMSRRLNSDIEKDNGLIGYWRLDEGSDDRVINLVSKTPATIHGAKWFPTPTLSEQTTTADTNPPES